MVTNIRCVCCCRAAGVLSREARSRTLCGIPHRPAGSCFPCRCACREERSARTGGGGSRSLEPPPPPCVPALSR